MKIQEDTMCTDVLLAKRYSYAVAVTDGAIPHWDEKPYLIVWFQSKALLSTDFKRHHPSMTGRWRITAVAEVNDLTIERAAREFARYELREVWGEI